MLSVQLLVITVGSLPDLLCMVSTCDQVRGTTSLKLQKLVPTAAVYNLFTDYQCGREVVQLFLFENCV